MNNKILNFGSERVKNGDDSRLICEQVNPRASKIPTQLLSLNAFPFPDCLLAIHARHLEYRETR